MLRTTNYQLHLREGGDPVRRAEFNADNEIIDAALAGQQAAIDAKADQTALDITNSTLKELAKQLPYVVGTYDGTGEDVSVTLGFRPSFVMICGHIACSASNSEEYLLYAFTATRGNVVTSRIQITDTGFIALKRGSAMYPDLSFSSRTYDYIAFR